MFWTNNFFEDVPLLSIWRHFLQATSLDDTFCGNFTLSYSIILVEDLIRWNKGFETFWIDRSSRLETFLGKGALKIFSNLTREHICRSVVSKKLQSNFVEIRLWHWWSPVSFLHISRKLFPKNTSGLLLLYWSLC